MRKDLDILRTLAATPGPTNHEASVQEQFLRLMKPYAGAQRIDGCGNAYAIAKGRKGGRTVLFNAHCDSIGFMVKYIDDQGFIFTQDLGGTEMVDYRTFPGSSVQIFCRKTGEVISGNICPMVPYHLDGGTEDEQPERSELHIDIGSKTEAETLRKVSIGDYIVFAPHFEELVHNQRLTGTHMDNRVGLYIMYMLARQLKKSRATVVYCSTTGEENYAGMAGQIAEEIKPDIAITLDLTPAPDSIVWDADFSIFKRHGKIKLDDGPVLVRGPGVTEDVFLRMEKVARAKKIKTQIETSSWDTDNVFIHKRGIQTGLVMVPGRYLHTQIETVSLKDIDATTKLCAAFVDYINSGKAL